jgi:hypothetical protein
MTILKAFVVMCQVGSAVTAGLAAWYWFRFAAKPAPPMTFDQVDGLTTYLDDVSKQNRKAAGWTGVSVVLAAVATVCGSF